MEDVYYEDKQPSSLIKGQVLSDQGRFLVKRKKLEERRQRRAQSKQTAEKKEDSQRHYARQNFNDKMHPKNIYKSNTPDFGALAEKYPGFKK